MKVFSVKILILMLLFALTTVVSAQEVVSGAFYVSPHGSDANDGRSVEDGGTGPWQTIQKAAASAEAGDTVYVREGIYSEPKGMGIASDSAGIEIVNDGYEGAFIRILGFPGERPVVDMRGLSACFSIYGGSYIEISGFEMRNCSTGGVWIRSGSAQDNHHITISDNIIHHVDGVKGGNVGGIRADHVTDTKISNNLIYHIRVAGELNGNASGIHSYRMGNMEIEHNEISDAYNGIFHKHPNFIGLDVGEFRYNIISNVNVAFRFENSEGLPDSAYHKNAKIHHNLVFKGGFLYDNTFRAKTQSVGLQIFNNTIIGSGLKVSGFSDVSVYNNIFYGDAYLITQHTDDVLISDERHAGSLGYVDYNIYFPEFYAVLGQYGSLETRYDSLKNWQNTNLMNEVERLAISMNSAPDINSRIVDPMFKDPTSLDYSIAQSSPIKGLGKNGTYIGAYGGVRAPGLMRESAYARPAAPVLSVD